jgi:tetratricopeptide (TPR) repeat protein
MNTQNILLHLKSGNAKEAISLLDSCTSEDHALPEYHELRGMALTMIGNLRAAQASLEHSVKLAPSRPSAQFNLALVLDRSDQLEDAAETCQTVLLLDPAHAGARMLEKRIADKLRDRRYTDASGFAVISAEDDPSRRERTEWHRNKCPNCGGLNHITRRTCNHCSLLLPELDPVVPVE